MFRHRLVARTLGLQRSSGGDVETLAEIIRDLAEATWDEHITFVDASYEEMGKA